MRLNERLNGRMRSSRSDGHRDRGQAEVVGLVLIIGMTVAGLTVVVGFGAQALEDSQSESQIQRAEHAMTQLDSRASLVGLGTTDSQTLRTNFQGTNSDFYVDENAGWMNVTIFNESYPDQVEAHVMNVTLGAVVYESGETTVVYQGGGVWKKVGDGAVMVSPPEYHFQSTSQEPTLTLPVVVVSGDRNLDSTVSIKRDGAVESKYPDAGNDLSNPFDGGIVEVTVHSDYYEAWGQFMEERADGEVVYDHDRETVTSRLIGTGNRFKITSGTHVTNSESDDNRYYSSSGESGVYQYNSSYGSYEEWEAAYGVQYGEVVTEGGIEIKGDRFNTSNVVSGGGEVVLDGGWIPGNLSYSGWIDNKSSMDYHVRGWVRKGAEVPSAKRIGTLVEDKHDAFRADNDNDDTSKDDDDDIVFSGVWELDDSKSEWDLTAGRYFINTSGTTLDSDDQLTIDLSEGDVEIVISGDVTVQKGANINVTNPEGGTAKIYLSGKNNPSFEVTSGSSVTVEGDKSPSLWIYGRRQEITDFDINDGSSFTGVLYAPGRESTKTRAFVTGDSAVYGAIVTTEIEIRNNGSVYFDMALDGTDPLSEGQYTSDLTFLHISVNKIKVES